MNSTSPNSILTRLLVSGAFLAGEAATDDAAVAIPLGDDRFIVAAEMMRTPKQPVTA